MTVGTVILVLLAACLLVFYRNCRIHFYYRQQKTVHNAI